MTFYNKIQAYDWEETTSSIYSKTKEDVKAALAKDKLDLEDFKALISPVAIDFLEEMAAKSRALTQKRYGKTMQMYAPLYVSNHCTNHCVYCGFNHSNDIGRKILTDDEIRNESEYLRSLGFEHLLLVSGEDNRVCGIPYLKGALKNVKQDFAQVSIEVQPLKTEEYVSLKEEGLHAVYLYQETYNEERYKTYHPKGRKSNYQYRLEGPDRIGEAGIHKIGLGVLLGLEDWRTDTFFTALHLDYLEKKYWQTKYSIAFPRLRPHAGGFEPNSIVEHKELVQLICAYRLFNEHVELSLSTRENAYFRDHMISLGVTTMSAGSKTNPGGYNEPDEELEQFSVSDERSPAVVSEAIRKHGYEVVWKDWEAYM